MPSIALRIQNISKKYRIGTVRHDTLRDQIAHIASSSFQRTKISKIPSSEIWALKDVSFDVHHGEIVGLIGRNGAGKSTLLKILSRITVPTSGRVEIYGRVGSLLEVGTGFHPELTGRENIYLNGAILGMSRDEINRKFDEIVAFSEIEKFLDTPVKRYSSGMYVRLAFAVAAHLDTEILLVDEVLAVGDTAFQRKCLTKMDEVSRKGRTVLFVSHNMGAVQSLCSRGIVLQNGGISIDAPMDIAVTSYLNSLEKFNKTKAIDRIDRTGRGNIKLQDVDINLGNESHSGVLTTGRSANFIFFLSELCKGVACTFTIYDQRGQPITNFNSAFLGNDDSYASDYGKALICYINNLPLIPGSYRINVAISHGGILEDHLEAAAFFEVEQGSLGGRQVSVDSRYGNVRIPHRWIFPQKDE